MTMIPLRGLGKLGVIADSQSQALPIGAWGDARNIRFSGLSFEKMLEPELEMAVATDGLEYACDALMETSIALGIGGVPVYRATSDDPPPYPWASNGFDSGKNKGRWGLYWVWNGSETLFSQTEWRYTPSGGHVLLAPYSPLGDTGVAPDICNLDNNLQGYYMEGDTGFGFGVKKSNGEHGWNVTHGDQFAAFVLAPFTSGGSFRSGRVTQNFQLWRYSSGNWNTDYGNYGNGVLPEVYLSLDNNGDGTADVVLITGSTLDPKHGQTTEVLETINTTDQWLYLSAERRNSGNTPTVLGSGFNDQEGNPTYYIEATRTFVVQVNGNQYTRTFTQAWLHYGDDPADWLTAATQIGDFYPSTGSIGSGRSYPYYFRDFQARYLAWHFTAQEDSTSWAVRNQAFGRYNYLTPATYSTPPAAGEIMYPDDEDAIYVNAVDLDAQDISATLSRMYTTNDLILGAVNAGAWYVVDNVEASAGVYRIGVSGGGQGTATNNKTFTFVDKNKGIDEGPIAYNGDLHQDLYNAFRQNYELYEPPDYCNGPYEGDEI